MVAIGTDAPVIAALGFGFLAALPLIMGGLGRVFGGASEASAQNDQARAQLEQQRAQTVQNQFQTQQQAQMQGGNLDLDRKKFDESSEGSRLKRALLGQLLGNSPALDISMPGIPKANISGGLSMNSLGPGGRDIGALMTARALQQLQQGNRYTGGEILDAPAIPEIGRLGGNKFLNVLGTIGSALGSIGGQRVTPTTGQMLNPNVLKAPR